MDLAIKQETSLTIKQEPSELDISEPEDEDTARDNYFNHQKIVNCKYCNGRCEPYKNPGLLCETCLSYVHISCLENKINIPRKLVGDVFFTYCCAECHPLDQDYICRGDKMSWLAVVILVLYHLRERSIGLSERYGFFHWKNDISHCVYKNWESLFPKIKRKKHWTGTISGTLSQYKSQCVKSGAEKLNESGYWKLMSSEPPEVIVYQNKKKIKLGKKKKHTSFEQELSSINSFSPSRSESVSSIDDEKDNLNSSNFIQINNNNNNNQDSTIRPISPTISESNSSVNDDNNIDNEQTNTQTPSMFSREYVQPTENLSNYLFDDDGPDDLLDVDDPLALYDNLASNNNSEFYNDNETKSGFNFTKPFDGLHSIWNSNNSRDIEHFDNDDDDDDAADDDNNDYQDEDSSEHEGINNEPQLSLFNQTTRRDFPWKKNIKLGKIRPRMSKYEENYLLATINKKQLDSASSSIRRLYRKLSIRKIKRDLNLPIFDFDNFNVDKNQNNKNNKKRIIDRFYNDKLDMMFEQRLQGFMELQHVESPYTGRTLPPFIRRDKNCRPLWLRIMEELKAKVNRNNKNWISEPIGTIDYCYVKPQHIPAMNSLCKRYFWSGVDLTECLQYPETTCVVLYKKLVIGFAVMIPDIDYNTAYISFVFTRPEWRKAGIGNFMMYHLTQTYMKKDLTLHVAVTNPALLLYQKFGFKVEEFIQNFYDKYVTPGPKESCHAFFLRLSQ